MIPLKDDVPSESFPFVTLGLVGLNVLVFLIRPRSGWTATRGRPNWILRAGSFAGPRSSCAASGSSGRPLSGILTFSRAAWGGAAAGGTAWFAHIGGFLAGMALLFLMRPRRVGRL